MRLLLRNWKAVFLCCTKGASLRTMRVIRSESALVWMETVSSTLPIIRTGWIRRSSNAPLVSSERSGSRRPGNAALASATVIPHLMFPKPSASRSRLRSFGWPRSKGSPVAARRKSRITSACPIWMALAYNSPANIAHGLGGCHAHYVMLAGLRPFSLCEGSHVSAVEFVGHLIKRLEAHLAGRRLTIKMHRLSGDWLHAIESRGGCREPWRGVNGAQHDGSVHDRDQVGMPAVDRDRSKGER